MAPRKKAVTRKGAAPKHERTPVPVPPGMEPVVNELLDRMQQGHGIEGAPTPTLRPAEVAERLSTTFAPGWVDEWEQKHHAAIDDATALLTAPLTADITREYDRATLEHRIDKLTPGEWCDLLEHQVTELRALEGADEDVSTPDLQARNRLVNIAGVAIACAEFLDRHMAQQKGRS